MSAASFTLKTSLDDRGPATVAVTGEVDATNAARFTAAVEDIATERPTVLDLSDLLYVDSAGFAALHRIVAGRAVAIALPAHSPLRKAAVLMDLPHHDNAENAAAALGSDGGHAAARRRLGLA